MRLVLVAGCLLVVGCYHQPSFAAFHRAAVAKRRQVARRAPKVIRPRARSRVKKHRWPFRYTEQQLAAFRRAGCRFDARDLKLARQAKRRGFTVQEWLQAYQDLRQHAGGNRAQLIAIAEYRVAGFDLKKWPLYQATSSGLTVHYNRTIARSSSPMLAGGIVTGIGGAMAVIGLALFIQVKVSIARCERNRSDELVECEFAATGVVQAINIGLATVGGVTAVTGGLIMLVSASNPYRHFAEPILDNADASTLRDFRRWRQIVEARQSGTTLSLSPQVSRGGGGLALRLTF